MKKSSLWKMAGLASYMTLAALMASQSQTTAQISTSGKAAQGKAGAKTPASGTASQGKAAAIAPQFTVLNPEAQLPEVDTKALSARLSSFAGKTIIIFDNRGGYDKPMRGLADQLKPLLPPDAKLVYYVPTAANMTEAELAKIPKGDAAIVGHAY
jgi:hypothetical protein